MELNKITQSVLAAVLVCCTYNAHAAPAPYPDITPPSGMDTASKISSAADWLNNNVAQVQISPGMYALMPKSYQASWQNYWTYLVDNNADYKQYLTTNDNGTCNVGPGNEATIERAVTNSGLDVYDGAVWSIALASAYMNPAINKTNKDYYLTSIQQYEKVLFASRSEDFTSYRAYKSNNGAYGYGTAQTNMPSANESYLLKFITPSWAANKDPIHGCNLQWPIYEAVTGEQAWAALIGPVQVAYVMNDGKQNAQWANSDWINSAIDSLPALLAMQDPLTGGVYRNVHIPGAVQKDINSISLENDFSLYAGLNMLETAIKARIDATPGIGPQSSRLDDALDKIAKLKSGLQGFFSSEQVFNSTDGYFVSAVESDGKTSKAENVFALDVQTWGISVILSDPALLKAVQDTHGTDALYRMWQAAIKYSAYRDSQGKLLGVGYTTQKPGDEHYEMSGEWTLGAITAAIDLATYYGMNSDEGKVLVDDAKAMQAAINTNIATVVQGQHNTELGYLYANKRALIPFGWYSNAMPATASTAWGLMVNSCYNPFLLGGGSSTARDEVCHAVIG